MQKDNIQINANKMICLVDDHEVVRIGIKTWLEQNSDYKILNDFGNIESCLEYLAEQKQLEQQESASNPHLPSALIVDIDLGKENGFDLVAAIKKSYPQIKTVVYSMHEESGYILQAKKIGADGFIAKADEMKEFLLCLDTVFKNQQYLNPKFQSKQNEIEEFSEFLTKKQNMVLQELLKNKTNEEISRELDLTLHTVEVYISIIYEAMGVRNRTELIQKFQ